jgi:hypothetical protein
MESASSANEGASRRILDSILDPFELESESQLGSTRDRATSGQRQESRERVDSILKRLDKGPRGKAFRFSGKWTISNTNFESGACRAQDFQEHVQERLVTTIPYTSINYIIFSYRRSDVFACNSPSNIGSTNSTVAVLGYIQSSETLQLRSIQKKWMNGELSWEIVVGGLCGSEEFTREIIDPRLGWTRVVALGDLRLNNVGRVKVFV